MRKDNLEPSLASNGLYRIGLGYHLVQGERKQKQHWLGRDKTNAKRIARALEAAWHLEQSTDAAGRKVWSKALLDRAFGVVSEQTRTPPEPPQIQLSAPRPVFEALPYTAPIPKPLEEPLPPAPLLLFNALDQFLDVQKARVAARKVDESNYNHKFWRIASIKRHIWNKPLRDIGKAELAEMRKNITDRPLSRRMGAEKRGVKISIITVRHWLMAMGSAFQWFHREGLWEPPVLDWRQEYFNLPDNEARLIMTLEEQHKYGKPKEVHRLDDLKIIYRLGTDWERMFMLMGICFGWTQKEIATLLRIQFIEHNGEYFIEKARCKNGNEGYWWVCPELAALMKKFIARTPANPDGLAFLSESGRPLQHTSGRTKTGRTDSIKLAWQRMLNKSAVKNAGIKWLPFSSLRKWGAQAIEAFSGSEELSQVFLAHSGGKESSGKSIARKHYIGLGVDIGIGQTKYERLHQVQKKVAAALKPMFDNAWNPKTKGTQSEAA